MTVNVNKTLVAPLGQHRRLTAVRQRLKRIAHAEQQRQGQ